MITYSNLRLIAVSSPIIKILEGIVMQELRPLIQDHNIVHKQQIGFKEKLGTVPHLFKIMGELKAIQARSLTSSKYYLIFIDFRRAFGSVHHGILFSKL